MEQQMKARQQNAKHLAARAVMAYRANFPVEVLSISNNSRIGIICDWKRLRASYGNDDKLIRRAFAFVYIGTIIDQSATEPISDNLQKEVLANQSDALDARQTAVLWGLAESVTNTDPFAHGGYKLASRLLRHDRRLIDDLARELFATETLKGEQLMSWFSDHAEPLALDELERTTTF